MGRAPRPRRVAALLVAVMLTAPPPGRAQDGSWGPVTLALAGSVSARSGEHRAETVGDTSRRPTRIAIAWSSITPGGLAGLVDGAIEARIPIDSTRRLDMSIAGVGYGAYRLVTLGVAVTIPVGPAFDATAGMRIETQSIDAYGMAATVILDAAATMRVSAALSLGMAAGNLTGSCLRGIARAQTVSLGALVAISDSADVSLDVEHLAGRGIAVACGGAAAIGPGLVVRGGARLDGSIVAAGFGFDDGDVVVDIAGAWVDALGVQCAAGVGMRW